MPIHQISPIMHTARGARLSALAVVLTVLGIPGIAAVRGPDGADAQSEALVYLEPEVTLTERGAFFDVAVVVRDAVDLGAFQLTLAFPPDLVAYDSLELGPFLGLTGRPVTVIPPIVRSDRITVGAVTEVGAPGASGEGTLLTLRFEALSSPGAGELALSDVLLSDSQNGNRTHPMTSNGRVVIDPTPAPSPSPTPADATLHLPAAYHTAGLGSR